MAVLRRAILADALQRVWNLTIGRVRRSLLRCPSCARAMNVVPTDGPVIDLCRGCQLLWFDAGELEAMPHRSAEEIAAEDRAARKDEKQQARGRRELNHEALTAWMTRRRYASSRW